MRKVQFQGSPHISRRIIHSGDFGEGVNPPDGDIVFDASNDFTVELTNAQAEYLAGIEGFVIVETDGTGDDPETETGSDEEE